MCTQKNYVIAASFLPLFIPDFPQKSRGSCLHLSTSSQEFYGKIQHMNDRQTQINHKKILRLIQRLRSLTFQNLSPTERQTAKEYLVQLDEKYTNNQISLEEYKFLSLTFLMNGWSVARGEQFLYTDRDVGNFLDQSEKFAICDFLAQNLQD